MGLKSQRPPQFRFRLGEFLDEGRILHERRRERRGSWIAVVIVCVGGRNKFPSAKLIERVKKPGGTPCT